LLLSSSGDQQIIVGCWGQKESVLTCYDMTPLLLLLLPPLWYLINVQ
jgi:hypothetical protein